MEALLHIQGDASSDLTPIFLVHAISGLALPYLSLGSLCNESERPMYGISSPLYERKSYTLPPTLDSLAQEYVNLIQREVQPHGPYLLGGWSMGGMIAIRMAALLESKGERVLHVILIDSANPQKIPGFVRNEHNILTSLTFKFLSRGLVPADRHEINSTGSDSSTVSEDDSDEYNDTDSSDYNDEDYFDDEVSVFEWLPRMRKHISNGLSLIACEDMAVADGAVSAPVTLIKCGRLDKLPMALSDRRKNAIQKLFDDPNSGWELPQLRVLTIPNAAHDHILDMEHAGELTTVMRTILDDIRR
ncbi:hypothetical protein VE03_05292 [Pseudogymnoascus sp. 23342-1-I1]|nr:hypothetical protein VE03_05292 [Pseudogymnoascus sp. 23342-1-I1]